MRSVFLTRLGAVATSAFLLTACGGGGRSLSPLPGAPQNGGGTGASPASVLVSGSITGSGPRIIAKARRLPAGLRRPMSLSKVSVTATIYPGTAGAVPVSNTISIAPPSGSTYTASVPLSNVPSGNNEWIIMSFSGVGGDGSSYALGELAGVVNVSGGATTTASLTKTTTDTAQVLLSMLASGYLSSYDIANTTTLASTITTDISGSGVTADAGTGLFTSGGLRTIIDKYAPAFARTLVVSGNPEITGSITIVRDYTSTVELNLVSNMQGLLGQLGLGYGFNGLGQTADAFLEVLGDVAGGPNCGFFEVTMHNVPPSGPVIPSGVSTCLMPFTATGTTVKGVYGGAILLGLTTETYSYNATPTATFKGGILKVAGRAAGTSTPETVTTASTARTIALNDPIGFAFGIDGYPFSVTPAFGTGELSNTTFAGPGSDINGGIAAVYVPTTYATTKSITIDTFNPYDIALANLDVCSNGMLPGCFAAGTTPPSPIVRVFGDAGTNLAAYNWKGSGTATTVTATGFGYKVTTSAAGAANLTTTTAAEIVPRQQITIQNSLGAGVRWTLTAKDASSVSYVGTGLNATSPYGTGNAAVIEMDSVLAATKMTSIELTATAPAGSFTFAPIASTSF